MHNADQLPSYLKEDSKGNVPNETPSPFTYVPRLKRLDESQPGTSSLDESFKFDTSQATKLPTVDSSKLPFDTWSSPENNPINLSLRSWTRGGESTKEGERMRVTAADSLILRPHPPVYGRRKTMNDVPELPDSERTDLETADSLPTPSSWLAKLTKWKRRKSKKQREEGKMSQVATPIRTSTDSLQAADNILSDLLGSMPDMERIEDPPQEPIYLPSTPTPVESSCPHCSSPGTRCKISPLSGLGGRFARVKFPKLESEFSLDSRTAMAIMEFNGYWKVIEGAKELQKTLLTLSQWKTLLDKFDSPMRIICIDSDTKHFKWATWSAMVQYQDQRPWSGQEVVDEGSRGSQVMSVKFDSAAITTCTKWRSPSEVLITNRFSMSPDRSYLELSVSIKKPGTTPRTSANHT